MQQRESAKKAAASAAAVGRSLSFDRSNQDENVVTRTASWLDRAKSVLSVPTNSNDGSEETESSGDLHNQIREVRRLITEGPMIEQTSAGLPDILDKAEEEARAAQPSPDLEPADKRLRTAEDAEALVGFLRSVRASAASGDF
jgi:hypothetical protein